MEKEEVTWSEAPNSVIHIAEELIEKYHPWLTGARIAFVMRSKAQKRGDRKIIGNTSKVPAKMQPYLEFDFLIWLSQEDYDGLTTSACEALIDHELMHCKLNAETGGWSIREHDIQEFAEIILRHGLWSHDLRQMDRAIDGYRQHQLPGTDQVTIAAQGKVVTITGEQLERFAERISSDA